VKTKHGIMLAGSTGSLREKAFRIGHMGPEATVENALSVLIALEDFLRQKGKKSQSGRAFSSLSLSYCSLTCNNANGLGKKGRQWLGRRRQAKKKLRGQKSARSSKIRR